VVGYLPGLPVMTEKGKMAGTLPRGRGRKAGLQWRRGSYTDIIEKKSEEDTAGSPLPCIFTGRKEKKKMKGRGREACHSLPASCIANHRGRVRKKEKKTDRFQIQLRSPAPGRGGKGGGHGKGR